MAADPQLAPPVAAEADLARAAEMLNAAKRPVIQEDAIRAGHAEVRAGWAKDRSQGRVTPAALFDAAQRHARPRTIYATDSGNGTFLAMEHLRLDEPGCFIGPIDYSCMGYAMPAAVAAKLANPDRDVVAFAGDGALLMTGLEMLTASQYKAAPVILVLRDGELATIFWRLPWRDRLDKVARIVGRKVGRLLGAGAG